MKTKILFSFDCEDYTSDRSTDMLVRLADTLERHGVRGHFQIVGLLARDIEKKGRQDVVRALERHAVGYHSYAHSLHPNIMEYTDTEDYGEGLGRFLEEETRGAEIVRRVFGREILCSACPPGNSFPCTAQYGYAKIGIPVYIGGVFDEADGLLRFCNILQVPYHYALEDYLFARGFDAAAFLDMLTGAGQITLYNHPNMICHTEFWDMVNYNKRNLVPFGEWLPAPERTQEEVDLFFANLECLLCAMEEDGDFAFTDLDEICGAAEEMPAIRREDAEAICRLLRTKPPYRYAQSELLLAAAAFLRDPERREYRCPEVYGFLDEPVSAGQKMSFTKEELAAAVDQIREGEFLPAAVRVAGKTIGPRDYLCAAWEVLAGEPAGHVFPQIQTEVPERYEGLRTVSFRGAWLNSDGFEDRYQSKRLRLQTWTLLEVPSRNAD